jgi:hypothetical protein
MSHKLPDRGLTCGFGQRKDNGSITSVNGWARISAPWNSRRFALALLVSLRPVGKGASTRTDCRLVSSSPARPRLDVARRRGDKPPLDSIGGHLTNRLGSPKKPIARKFSRALLKLLCQSFHRPLASRKLTLQIFAQADVVRIQGIGWPLHGSSKCWQTLKDSFYRSDFIFLCFAQSLSPCKIARVALFEIWENTFAFAYRCYS